MFKSSVVYEANLNAIEDTVVNQGGTSSGKTYSIMQVLFTKAIQNTEIITVAGEDVPKLKAGALRDALDIVNGSSQLSACIKSYNKTERVFEFQNGSLLEFKSYQSAQDAKTGKRDRLFINEANSFSHQVYEQLQLRTKKQVYLDYNPDAEFWAHEIVLKEKNTKLIISDHRHNPFIPQKLHDKIEALKEKDVDLWKVYARGLTGKIEGLVFRNHHLIDDLPRDDKGNITATLIGYGMDFGFTNDPTAVAAVYKSDGEIWIDEVAYDHNLTNPQISERLKTAGVNRQDEIIADSAEPKSIQELYNEGWNIFGAEKGPDSIKNGIDILKRYKLNVTRRSVNARKELRTYKWAVDKQGKPLNKPVDYNNHFMDALRYVALNKLSKETGFAYSFGR